jgi:hypothetical protein
MENKTNQIVIEKDNNGNPLVSVKMETMDLSPNVKHTFTFDDLHKFIRNHMLANRQEPKVILMNPMDHNILKTLYTDKMGIYLASNLQFYGIKIYPCVEIPVMKWEIYY